MKRSLLGVFILVLATSGLWGTVPVQISEEFFNEEIVIFYLSDFNLENPQRNPLIFEYYIGNRNYPCVFPEPVNISLEFNFRARIRSIGWTDFRSVATVTLQPFELKGPCRISNQIISTDFSNFNIPYDCPEDAGIARPYVELNGGFSDVDKSAMAELSNTILATGQLPAGMYSFHVKIINESTLQTSEITKTIRVVTPTSLELISPGNLAESVADFEGIFNRFPMFQWESERCVSCSYAIRICEYIPGLHSSTYDAIMDESILPFPDDGGYYPVGNNITSLNYDPSVAGKDLEFGRYYVWQVKKSFETSGGGQEMKSEIFGFYIEDPSGLQTARRIANPVEEMLKELLGQDRYETMKAGLLQGYNLSGSITLNGRTITAEELKIIIDGIVNESYQIQNVYVE